MASSLASQLASIRSHNASRLGSANALTSRDSYLFPPRVAAEQDHETVHALGVTGWEQLLDEDATLAQWPHGTLLFGEKSVKTDRTTLPKEANDEIDVAVCELLYLLGPVLLSRSAAKCLEWLVRRFRIHEYTPREVLRAFMPYHLTPQFSRMLQLIQVEQFPDMQFLAPVKKAQTPLPTSVLLQAMNGHLDLVRWIATVRAPAGMQVSRVHVPFWTSTLVQYCLYRRTPKRRGGADAQAVLAVLLPEILYMANAQVHSSEAVIGALMVLCSVSASFSLTAQAVRGLLESLARILSSPLASDVARAWVAACMSLCASPEDVADPLGDVAETQRLLSTSTVQALLSLPELTAQMSRALATHDVDAFAAQLLGALIEHVADPKAHTLLSSLLDEPSLQEAMAQKACVRLLLSTAKDTWEARVELLAQLRERYPERLDQAVDVARSQDEAQTWHVLRAILQTQATGRVPSVADATDDVALWLGVHGADVHAQHLALKHLLTHVQQGLVRAKDVLVREALMAALHSGYAVLLETLYAPANASLLFDAMDATSWADQLEARMATTSMTAEELTWHVRFLTTTLLTHAPSLRERVWRRMLWPHLLPTAQTPDLVPMMAKAAQSLDGVYARAMQQAQAETSSTSDAVTWTMALCDALVAQLHTCNEAMLLEELDQLCRAMDAPVSPGGALALMVLSQLLAQPQALPPRVWIALAYRMITLVHTHQLLAGQVEGVVLGDRVGRAVVQQVHDKLSRHSVRLLGVQALYAVLRHVPTAELDASLMVAVQCRTTPMAQLLLHAYQTLHAPGVGRVASAKLVPVLFEQLGMYSFSLLAGVWTTPGGQPPSVTSTTLATSPTLAALADALAAGALVPTSDVPTRLMAMRHAALLVQAATSQARLVDVQTLLPSLLVVLQDTTAVLRDAAAQLLCALDTWNKVNDAPRTIYGLEKVYGEASSALQYLDTPTYVKYTSLLAKEAGAFINDASFLASTHAAVLRGSGKKDTLFRTKVLCYLLSHAVCVPEPSVRVALLRMVRDVHAPCKLTTVLPLLQDAVSQPPTDAEYVHLLFDTMDASSVSVLTDRDTHTWTLLLQALRSDASTGLAQAALDTLQNGLCAALPADLREEAFLALAETLSDPHTTSVPEASVALRTLPVSDSVLVHVLRKLCTQLTRDDAMDDDVPTSKRARSATHEEPMRHAAVMLITVLESMQSRTLGMGAALVAALFDVVRAAIAQSATHLFNAEYLVQLAMQSLCNLFDHVTVLPTDVAQVVRADTIVHAIKVSSNMQSINHAILLLARFARLDAELVLHNIMPIFTFVGLNVLQRDDRFTLSVVEQTLRSIIPAFVNAVRPKVINDKDARLALWRETRSLLRIFSDASSHIPRHRRHVFFRLLIDVLGTDDFLAPVCMLLADRVAHRVSKTPSNSATLLQLPLGLVRAEPLRVRVHALNQMWAEIGRLLSHADDMFLAPAPKREYSEEHLSPVHQALTLLLFLQHALSKADATEADTCVDELEEYAWHTLCLGPADETVAQALDEARAPVLRMLPAPALLSMALQLLQGERARSGMPCKIPASLSRASLASLGLQWLEDMPHSSAVAASRTDHVALWTAVYEALISLWESHRAEPLGEEALQALYTCLQHATSAEHTALTQLLPRLLAHDATASTLQILTSIVSHVGVRALAQLNALVPYVAQAVQQGVEDERLAAGLSLLAALFKTLPQFMHAHVERAVRLMTEDKVQAMQRHSYAKGAFRRAQDALVKRMPAATLLDALTSVWRETIVSSTQLALLQLMQLTVREMDKAAVTAQYKSVFRFLLLALDGQRTSDDASQALTATVTRALHVYVTLALKLSESQFRPLFLRTYDWAVVDLLDDDAKGVQARTHVLYALVSTLLEQLHGMFVPFYAIVLDNARDLVREKPSATWHAVVHSVRLCAEADEGTFWTASRATKFVAPLVKALSYTDNEEVPRTLLALAHAVPDDTFLRTLNSALMSAANVRDMESRVRALSACASLWEAQGMALLTFVPETVAALTEVLDDVDPRVSAAALSLRGFIEEALGESLDSYLDAA
ncbi:90S preribosome protein [Malassezia pachydermatis]|uniref:U3 small nucleolar RNA-associated protein 10 n=1 Tax=Malassezia pachydermatis TaxID=77020 RepID=A0A0M8MQB8_9BASI|nr:u3 small nucleolar rna-associated protein 10 [Malassezia pachydermatis]KOS14697.1 u3 small nucleolar rna-associated protein 10 [Malassezia pachydermatis]